MWKRLSVQCLPGRSQTFQGAPIITSRLLGHMPFQRSSWEAEQAGEPDSFPAELPLSRGEDMSSQKENNQKEKTSPQVGFEMVFEERVGLRGGIYGLANNYRGHQGTPGFSKTPWCGHSLSYSLCSPARLRGSAFSSSAHRGDGEQLSQFILKIP